MIVTMPRKIFRSNISQAPENLPSRSEKAKNGDLNPNAPLTEMQRKFVVFLVDHQMTQTAAARAAGFGGNHGSTGYDLMRHPKIIRAVSIRRAEYAVASQVTKKRVIDGFLESIEMAKLKSDPIAMVAGWREVGKMCGFYEPTKAKIEVSVNGRVLIERMSAMSDEELLKLAEENADVLEGEFRAIDDQTSS